jgi:replicative DNA helicase
LEFTQESLLAILRSDSEKKKYINFLCKGIADANALACCDLIILKYVQTNSEAPVLSLARKLQAIPDGASRDYVRDMAAEFFSEIESLYPDGDDQGKTFAVSMDEFWEDVNNQANSGIKTTLPAIDKQASGGWHPTSMVTVGGASGAGKTTYAIQEALNVAARGKRVVFFTTEMAPKLLAAKMTAREAGVEFKSLVSEAVFLPDDPTGLQIKLVESEGRIREHEILFYDVGYRSDIEFICQKINNLCRQNSCDFVVIDYLQILSCADAKSFRNNRTEELKEICRQVKLCAVRNKITIMALAQLNREAEGKIDLKMEHIADSSYIPRFSDFVMLLNRTSANGGTEFRYAYHIVKNRYGPVFARPMLVNLALQSFKEHPTEFDVARWFSPDEPCFKPATRRR